MGPVVNDFTYTPTVYADSNTPVNTLRSSAATYTPITYNNVFATAADDLPPSARADCTRSS